MRTPKALPVVLRRAPLGVEILVFTHPLADVQIVKGTVEVGESVNEAAVRELAEESGIKNSQCARDLGTGEECAMGQVWHFREMIVEQELPDDWTYFTQDGGGHLFKFTRHPLHGEPPSDCHAVFVKALRFISKRIAMATDRWPAVGASLLER